MRKRSCMEMLQGKFEEGKNVCVGLDTSLKEISKEVEEFLRGTYCLPPSGASGPLMLAFNREIIEATKDLVACYKLNRAFYEGMQGVWALHMTSKYLKDAAPDMSWIFDSKYGDVGNTCKEYARYVFEELCADAVTVNPWGGYADGLDVFFDHKNKCIFVWCRGSNKGSRELQDIEITRISSGALYDQPFYEFVAEVVSGFNEYTGPAPQNGWNKFLNCGVVVGATEGGQLSRVRGSVGDMPILVPGIGAQGGELEAAVKEVGYMDPQNGQRSLPALFNSSRGIIYKEKGPDFAKEARAEVIRLQSEIDRYRS